MQKKRELQRSELNLLKLAVEKQLQIFAESVESSSNQMPLPKNLRIQKRRRQFELNMKNLLSPLKSLSYSKFSAFISSVIEFLNNGTPIPDIPIDDSEDISSTTSFSSDYFIDSSADEAEDVLSQVAIGVNKGKGKGKMALSAHKLQKYHRSPSDLLEDYYMLNAYQPCTLSQLRRYNKHFSQSTLCFSHSIALPPASITVYETNYYLFNQDVPESASLATLLKPCFKPRKGSTDSAVVPYGGLYPSNYTLSPLPPLRFFLDVEGTEQISPRTLHRAFPRNPNLNKRLATLYSLHAVCRGERHRLLFARRLLRANILSKLREALDYSSRISVQQGEEPSPLNSVTQTSSSDISPERLEAFTNSLMSNLFSLFPEPNLPSNNPSLLNSLNSSLSLNDKLAPIVQKTQPNVYDFSFFEASLAHARKQVNGHVHPKPPELNTGASSSELYSKSFLLPELTDLPSKSKSPSGIPQLSTMMFKRNTQSLSTAQLTSILNPSFAHTSALSILSSSPESISTSAVITQPFSRQSNTPKPLPDTSADLSSGSTLVSENNHHRLWCVESDPALAQSLIMHPIVQDLIQRRTSLQRTLYNILASLERQYQNLLTQRVEMFKSNYLQNMNESQSANLYNIETNPLVKSLLLKVDEDGLFQFPSKQDLLQLPSLTEKTAPPVKKRRERHSLQTLSRSFLLLKERLQNGSTSALLSVIDPDTVDDEAVALEDSPSTNLSESPNTLPVVIGNSSSFRKTIHCMCSTRKARLNLAPGGSDNATATTSHLYFTEPACSDVTLFADRGGFFEHSAKNSNSGTQTSLEKAMSDETLFQYPSAPKRITCPCLLAGEPCDSTCMCDCCSNPLNTMNITGFYECAKGNLLAVLRLQREGWFSDRVALPCRKKITALPSPLKFKDGKYITIPPPEPANNGQSSSNSNAPKVATAIQLFRSGLDIEFVNRFGNQMHFTPDVLSLKRVFLANEQPHRAYGGYTLLDDFTCICGEHSYASLCLGGNVNRNQWYHCAVCQRCFSAHYRHCSRCACCEDSFEIGCSRCAHRHLLNAWRTNCATIAKNKMLSTPYLHGDNLKNEARSELAKETRFEFPTRTDAEEVARWDRPVLLTDTAASAAASAAVFVANEYARTSSTTVNPQSSNRTSGGVKPYIPPQWEIFKGPASSVSWWTDVIGRVFLSMFGTYSYSQKDDGASPGSNPQTGGSNSRRNAEADLYALYQSISSAVEEWTGWYLSSNGGSARGLLFIGDDIELDKVHKRIELQTKSTSKPQYYPVAYSAANNPLPSQQNRSQNSNSLPQSKRN